MKTTLVRLAASCALFLSTSAIALSADTLTIVLQPEKDAFICDCQPTATNPGGPLTKLFEGPYYTGGHGCHARALMYWNLTGLPANAIITNAVISMRCTDVFGTLTGQMAFYRQTQDWNASTVTHNTAPSYSMENPIVANWPAAGQWFSVNITDMARFWCARSDSNFGILGHSVNTTSSTGAIGYYSSRADSAQRPTLTLTYVTNISDVQSGTGNLPSQFHLEAYPNPFNPATNISFTLDKAGFTFLNIFDIGGRVIERLAASYQSAGTHRIEWNANRFPSGIYLVSLVSGNKRMTKKVVLMK